MNTQKNNNFAPPELRSIALTYLVCATMALGVVLLAMIQSRADLGRAERTLKTARDQVHVVERAEAVVLDMHERIGALRTELSDYTRLDPGSMTAILAAVVKAIPDAVELDTILLANDGDGVRAEITGVAPDAPAFARLKDSLNQAFASLRMTATDDQGAGPGEAFRASFSVETVETVAAAGAEVGS